MSYNYTKERAELFTEDGVKTLREVEAEVDKLLMRAGAFRYTHLRVSGNSFTILAALDYLIETKKLVRLPRPSWAQYYVYTTPEVHNL